jgi:hypothetical protein
MKYSLQQLDKAAAIVNKVKELDASIIALDALAQKVSENNIEYTLKVTGDLPSEKKESVLDSDGSLKKTGEETGQYFSMMSIFGRYSSSSETKTDNTLVDVKLQDVDMLTMIGVLLASKYEQREHYKQQVRELGIEI